ncbi:hypothetical protein CRP01_14960 [Flavilitoribacter nigricans DSM 23189 = NBRC 102662]|uniref:Cytochrome c domain-containing protein n=2 Tax=Flavilitoribacter TaxID=2762562 RepID=A0A2D0NDP0_FLAN2|nr:hypothetical protein CRP01_14960 [Flavilitoribacter nigricans DSM 23189 = NBRC 102662]
MEIPADNQLTVAGVALGKQLFFDPLLSADSTVSCSSCHLPGRAFTDGQILSRGVAGHRSLRNSPSLLNVGYQTEGLFWDGRVNDLEELIVHPVQDTNEMAGDWTELTTKLRDHPEYPLLFRKAFGIDTVAAIDQELTVRAIAQYLRTLVSGNSRYDRYKAGEVILTASEDRGRRIFFDIEDGVPTSECGHCHVEPLFSGLEYFNNGLDEVYDPKNFPDAGKGGISGRVGEMGSFRTPSLRNVALTAPYMHDGRFATLEEVMDHYVSGGKYSENVHPNVRRLDFSERDKADLIAFLQTLTESEFLKESN